MSCLSCFCTSRRQVVSPPLMTRSNLNKRGLLSSKRISKKKKNVLQKDGGNEHDEDNDDFINDKDVSELDFAHCSLDEVPPLIFSYERTLERLYLDSNNLSDLPRELFNCTELRKLNISDNNISSIPSQPLTSLSNLEELYVGKNLLNDVPESVNQLKNLTVLDLSINPLQKLPECCTQLGSLTQLYLNDVSLHFLPANIGRLTSLIVLEVRENALTTLPKSMARLRHLQRLDIGSNDMDQLPVVVGELRQLTELWIDANLIVTIPDIIGNLTSLTHLDGSGNQLKVISSSIGKCEKLTNLTLTSNNLRELPESIGNLHHLMTLKVEDNFIHKLPLSIGRLSSLEEFVLNRNYLTCLPPNIGQCSNLQYLNIDCNQLTSFPIQLSMCVNLKILSANSNKISKIPSEFQYLSNLIVLSLVDNHLSNLPISLVKLKNISALWLSFDQSAPIMQLKQEVDVQSGEYVLTNFVLPQQQRTSRIDADNKTQYRSGGGVPTFHETENDFVDEEETYYNTTSAAALFRLNNRKSGFRCQNSPQPTPTRKLEGAGAVTNYASEATTTTSDSEMSVLSASPSDRRKTKKSTSSVRWAEDSYRGGRTSRPGSFRKIEDHDALRDSCPNGLTKDFGYPVHTSIGLNEINDVVEKNVMHHMACDNIVDCNSSQKRFLTNRNDNAMKYDLNQDVIFNHPSVVTDFNRHQYSNVSPDADSGDSGILMLSGGNNSAIPTPPLSSISSNAGEHESEMLMNLKLQNSIPHHNPPSTYVLDNFVTSSSHHVKNAIDDALNTLEDDPPQLTSSHTKRHDDQHKKEEGDNNNLDTEAFQHARYLRLVSEQLMSNPRTRQSVTGVVPCHQLSASSSGAPNLHHSKTPSLVVTPVFTQSNGGASSNIMTSSLITLNSKSGGVTHQSQSVEKIGIEKMLSNGLGGRPHYQDDASNNVCYENVSNGHPSSSLFQQYNNRGLVN